MIRFRRKFFFVLALVAMLSGRSATIIAQAPYTVEHLGQAEGLPSQKIRAVAQDQHGLMWFAAYGAGLIRFDGWNYTLYNTEPNSVPRLGNCGRQARAFVAGE